MRPSKDQYYLNIAKAVAGRSTCFRSKGGAIIVRDDQIISTGYIGAPRKTKDCLERGNCLRDELNVPRGTKYELCRSVHAEANVIINAARAGVSLLNGSMYLYIEDAKTGEVLNAFPCFFCKRMIVNSGLDSFIALKDGEIIVHKIKDWVEEWREKDIVEDKYKYGGDQNDKK